ncbi:P-loop containing nucleoside triphosphate hydrolase protein [Lobosporangium transversale]|uniref:RNA helicase n=1 Tax=Lobosporangium transversale TaxID=64571 RepID=A0A1Y2H0Y9_9FUNG|nr:P-loop containing nucleoside triphosphate hydrolase protein [Lobosporangium transversale]ORZ28195.1 P-loop containing nucleoside triphosphate hydrolase protein [Lobosporangium transversale]|eukprot:XP_021885880.1 P-loop containing nucleoside triphosphate hydrolase protein [Lobosporangium transversale]
MAESFILFIYLFCGGKPTVLTCNPTLVARILEIPQYLHEAGWTARGRVVACTQPRRVAATTVAQRVADEMRVQLGMEVGYTIRFEDCTDPGGKTRIKYMTDGMLFREALMDPLLSKYSAIMLDEAHERSLYTDILMGVLKKILKKRPELRVIISSATLDAEAFAAFFSTNKTPDDASLDNTAILSVQGRMYPVDIHYLAEPSSDYIETAIQTVFDIHTKEPAGDILVFMTGREEIEQVVNEIRERATTLPPNKYAEILALPIYAGLAPEEQMLVFELPERGVRKVIVATNVAEASITIPGIGFVVDTGFVKIRAYNPRTGIEALTTTSISQASAEQRSGRAGRIRNGKAYRLYTEQCFHNDMRVASVPEIQRSNLAGMVLQLKALGIENVLRFEFMTSPPAEMMSKALELLYSLKALDEYGRLTIPLGMRLAEFPLDPLLGKILLDSEKFGCGQEMLTIAAMVSVQGPHNLSSCISGQGARYDETQDASTMIRKCLVSGYFAQAAKIAPDGTHWTSVRESSTPRFSSLPGYTPTKLWMHPTSILFKQAPKWVIFHEVVETSQAKAFMREVSVIEPEWLEELAPHFYQIKKQP